DPMSDLARALEGYAGKPVDDDEPDDEDEPLAIDNHRRVTMRRAKRTGDSPRHSPNSDRMRTFLGTGITSQKCQKRNFFIRMPRLSGVGLQVLSKILRRIGEASVVSLTPLSKTDEVVDDLVDILGIDRRLENGAHRPDRLQGGRSLKSWRASSAFRISHDWRLQTSSEKPWFAA